jgi:hypothetical protein
MQLLKIVEIIKIYHLDLNPKIGILNITCVQKNVWLKLMYGAASSPVKYFKYY